MGVNRMSNALEIVRQENLKLRKEIDQLSIKLEHAVLDLKKARLKNQEDRIKFERLKFKLEQQITKIRKAQKKG